MKAVLQKVSENHKQEEVRRKPLEEILYAKGEPRYTQTINISGDQPLPKSVRAFFDLRFEHDSSAG